MKNEVGATYQLNLAEEINSKGLNGGSVTLEYNYLRCVAGSYKSVYIDRNSELYFGKVIPNDGKLYKNNIAVQTSLLTPIDDENVSQGQDISSEQLIRNRFAYEIAGISPNRKEVKVRLKDTLKDNQDYKDQFIEFKSDISNLNYSKDNSFNLSIISKYKNEILNYLEKYCRKQDVRLKEIINLKRETLLTAKKMGFSDIYLSELLNCDEKDISQRHSRK